MAVKRFCQGSGGMADFNTYYIMIVKNIIDCYQMLNIGKKVMGGGDLLPYSC